MRQFKDDSRWEVIIIEVSLGRDMAELMNVMASGREQTINTKVIIPMRTMTPLFCFSLLLNLLASKAKNFLFNSKQITAHVQKMPIIGTRLPTIPFHQISGF
eukprot:GFUD01081499.1.p2 GENE.GFUD01081499.1~~GFUD01081499.1.p2  ORF type:complete len:102 (-),score=16.93 GFUD01081499.1:68-373(-)